MKQQIIQPSQQCPELKLKSANKESLDLSKEEPDNFTALFFYRGLHCPICKKQLQELEKKLSQFSQRGVDVFAISMDNEKRAEKTLKDWELKELNLCYGLEENVARNWGLFLSEGIPNPDAIVEESKIFNEPALFLIKPDGTLYCSSVQTMPFARPPLDDIISAIDFILDKDYPPRGTYK